jgi:hypothetical protein
MYNHRLIHIHNPIIKDLIISHTPQGPNIGMPKQHHSLPPFPAPNPTNIAKERFKFGGSGAN